MQQLFLRYKKFWMSLTFVLVFIFSLLYNIPAVMIARIVHHYSRGYLELYNPKGTFWHGGGLLAVTKKNSKDLSPLLLINWDVKLGITKFATIDFSVDNARIAELYIDKSGVNLDNLNMNLSITQISQMLDLINTLSLSGNLEIKATHIHVGKTMDGTLAVDMDQVSSNIAPVNPLGSYQMQFDLATDSINVNSKDGSNLEVNGSGNLQQLILSCKPKADKKDKMLEFMTVMGIPDADGSYRVKVF